jgi:hypothetical protein
MIKTAGESHQHESNGEWQHFVEPNRREFWLSRCKHRDLGLTRRSKPQKKKKSV